MNFSITKLIEKYLTNEFLKLEKNSSFQINQTMVISLFLKRNLKIFIFFKLKPHMLLFNSGLLSKLDEVKFERVIVSTYFFERKYDMESMASNIHLGKNNNGEFLVIYPKGMNVVSKKSIHWLKKINPDLNFNL